VAKTKQPRGLSVKQRRFIEAYNGNATEAAIAAGYSPKTARSQAQRMLTNVDISKAIYDRENERIDSLIMTREERQALWSEIARDKDENIMARLKASELLGKSEADFIERKEVTGKDGEPLIDARNFHITYELIKPKVNDG